MKIIVDNIGLYVTPRVSKKSVFAKTSLMYEPLVGPLFFHLMLLISIDWIMLIFVCVCLCSPVRKVLGGRRQMRSYYAHRANHSATRRRRKSGAVIWGAQSTRRGSIPSSLILTMTIKERVGGGRGGSFDLNNWPQWPWRPVITMCFYCWIEEDVNFK